MSSDRQGEMIGEIPSASRTWIEMIASACFVEELDLDSLPLSERVKNDVRSILGELARLSPLEALSRCISIHSESLPRAS